MAWIRCCGGSVPKPKDIYMLNNQDYHWDTTTNESTPYTNYTYVPYSFGLRAVQTARYITTYFTSPEIDLTNYNSLSMVGNVTLNNSPDIGSGSMSVYILLLDSAGNTVATWFSASATTQSGSRTYNININADLSTYRGKFKIRFQTMSCAPNINTFSLSKFEILQ